MHLNKTKATHYRVASCLAEAPEDNFVNDASLNTPTEDIREHKQLYRSVYQDVPIDYYTLPFGKASLIKEGNNVTIISFGAGVHWALETLSKNTEISADLIDLRSLQPLDTDTIFNSIQKTNRAIILQEDSIFGGIASDISALILENCFHYLDAPVIRVGSLESPIPFVKSLEDQYLPKDRFELELKKLLEF